MENAAARQPDGFARALRASQRQISQESPPAEDFSASANLRSFFHAIRSSSCSLLRPVSPQADRVYLCPVMGPGYFSTQKRFPVTWKHVTGKESHKFAELKHVRIEKAKHLFWACSFREML